MAATTSSLQIGWKAAEFDLEGTDERHRRLAEACGPKGMLVMFICNHCPYVQAVLDDIFATLGSWKRMASGRSQSCRTIPEPIPLTRLST